jgi:hypothetical protein
MTKKELTEKEKREELARLLAPLLKDLGHELIRKIYQKNNELRNILRTTKFPISTLYHLSLTEKLNNEYGGLKTIEIAKLEGIKKRCAFLHRQRFYKEKRKLSKNQV